MRLSTCLLVMVSALALCGVSLRGSVGGIAPQRQPASLIYALYPKGIAEFDPATGTLVGFLKVHLHGDTIAAGAGDHVFVSGVVSAAPGSQVVAEYAPRNATPLRYFFTGYEDGNIAVSGGGELAVVGVENGCCTTRIEIYAPGLRSPPRIIKAGEKQVGWLAYDRYGNCWVDGSSKTGRFIGYIAPGATTITQVSFLPMPLAGPMTFDPWGHIVIASAGQYRVYDTSSGAQLSATEFAGKMTPSSIAVSADGSTLYATSRYSLIETFRYPSGGVPLRAFGWYSNGIAIGGR